MRALLLPLMLVAALTACGEARNIDGGEAAAAEVAPILGEFKAASEDARALLGDVGVERAGLIFANGGALYTRTFASRRGDELAAVGGRTFAAIASGAPDMQVELRRVIDTTALDALCGDDQASYVALAHDTRGARFALLVFSGDDAPGPAATQSRLCASYAYALTLGPHMREGVVL